MKNRDYTGLIRTPSSMAWLIGQRARVKGQLDRLRRLEGALPEKIKTAEAELASLDAVIPLHEVKIDPSVIVGRQPHRPRAAPHGSLTKFLLRRLREAAGKPIYTSELALQFAREHEVDLSRLTQADLMDRVKKRLGVLAAMGTVRRHHATATTDLGSWSLVMDAHEPENV
jgi:hypothetical protein